MIPAYQKREIAVPPYMPLHAMRKAMGVHGLGALTTGDYHIVGEGVTLRTRPEAGSQPIASLSNGEGVYVFGDVETDLENMIGPNNTAIPNDGKSPGIEYARIGTQNHGSGFVAVKFLAQGAGNATQPQQQPAPVPPPTDQGMSLVSKVFLGGAIVATVAGGAFFLGKAISESRPRRLAHA